MAEETYTADAFGFFRVPHKYIDTGIRGDRANPFLFRATAQVELPAGTHRILLRGRGACRLYIDNKLVLETKFPGPITDGHNHIPTDYLDLGPDFRFAPPGNREKWTTFRSEGKTHDVRLESIVGGKRGASFLRPEMGETVAALSLEGTTSFRLLAPKRIVPYTDAGWREYAEVETKRIARLEAQRRAEAFAKHSGFWQKRHAAAREWVNAAPKVNVPPLPKNFPANNAIDHFLAANIVANSKAETLDAAALALHKEAKAILDAKCASCHAGKKIKGGLRLDAEGIRAGGNSDVPALVPGNPDKSLLIERITTKDNDEIMPPSGDRLSEKEITALRDWIKAGARWPAKPKIEVTRLCDDLTFLRRLALDTVGVVPTPAEIDAFLADTRPDKRAKAIEHYLADPRWADHWVGYWQDVLGENPNILNPTLNNTGPFRWWIYEAFLDDKTLDVFATELVLMRGSHYAGGPLGFAAATQNDVPMAEKAAIVSSAFLGVHMKCARCHDSPAHKSTQRDLFQLASLLNQAPLAVPSTSSVPKDKIHGQGRKPLIKVTLEPGTKVAPAWPFAEFISAKATVSPPLTKGGQGGSKSPRDQLADLLTSPRNERFAQVMANRIWKRFMGRGIVEPVDDWEKGQPTHPELLKYLGRELVQSGYQTKHLARLILNSHAYQRTARPGLKEPDPLYAAPMRRRLSAEQIVDSLFLAAGKSMDTEEVSLDVDGGRDMKNSISLGKPRRAWQFASTSNERDRPSLALPRVQAVVDLLEAFGWRSSRQFAQTDRETAPNVIQPALMSNGVVSVWLTRLSDEHGVTQLALGDQPLEALVDQLFLRVLTRRPTAIERDEIMNHMRPGYGERIVKNPPPAPVAERRPPKYVSWSNHLTPEANEIKVQLEAEARRGSPPTPRLEAAWRQRMEDVLWAVLNSSEFIFYP